MASTGGSKGGKPGKPGPQGLSAGSGSTSESAADRKARRAEAVAAMKREQSRRETRSRLLMASGVVVAVLIVVAVGVYVGLNKSTSPAASASGRQTASATVATDVTNVPSSVFDTVGVGSAIAAPKPTGDGPTLTGGKVPFLYVGAEYCPYCAAERWAMAASLGRFGTFSDLKTTTSSATDANPNTPTLSFYKATYTSKYVDFTAVETETNTGKPLETLSGDAATTEQKYNNPPYVASDGAGAIPFVDIADAYVTSGATLDGTVLANQSYAEIGTAMQDPSTDIAKAVDGAANLFTAAICNASGGQPGSVCNTAGVQAATKALTQLAGKSGGSSS